MDKSLIDNELKAFGKKLKKVYDNDDFFIANETAVFYKTTPIKDTSSKRRNLLEEKK